MPTKTQQAVMGGRDWRTITSSPEFLQALSDAYTRPFARVGEKVTAPVSAAEAAYRQRFVDYLKSKMPGKPGAAFMTPPSVVDPHPLATRSANALGALGRFGVDIASLAVPESWLDVATLGAGKILGAAKVLPMAGVTIFPNMAAREAATEKMLQAAQKISSADTSIKQIPALFKSKIFQSAAKAGDSVADIGAGRFADLSSAELEKLGLTHYPFDPYSRAETAAEDLAKLQSRQHPLATANNVLNVIAEPEARAQVIERAANALTPEGKAFFQIYEGNKSGIGAATKKGFQNNLPASAYVDEIKKYFDTVARRGNIITATGKK